jgi:hypothetical protein
MTIDVMEIKEDQLIDGIAIWTDEDFLKYTIECKILLYT